MSTNQAAESLLLKIETSFISADLNSVILYVFLMGIYTMVFVWTIHLYTNRGEKGNKVVTATLVALYLVNLVNLGVQWQIIKRAVVDNGATRTTIYEALQISDGALEETSSVAQFVGYILADGLLIWRCFNIYNRSIRAIFIPLVLYFCVIALSIVSIVLFGLYEFDADMLPAFSHLTLELVVGGGIVNIVDAAFSLSATFMIYRRISSSLETEMLNKGRYKRITRVAMESAALYSITGVVLAIVGIINSTVTNEDGIILAAVAINYILTIDFIVTGVAPTIMVARICLSSTSGTPETTDHTSTHPASALHFHHQQSVHSTIFLTEAERVDNSTPIDFKTKEEA